VTRYFDHIQSVPSIRTSAGTLGDAFKVIYFDLEGAPKFLRKAEALKKKEKVSKVPAAEAAAPIASTSKEPVLCSSAQAERPQKKEKKTEMAPEPGSSKAVGGKKGGKAPQPDDGEPVPSMIDLRVGRIVDGKSSPNFVLALILRSFLICSHQTSRRRWVVRRGMVNIL